MVKKKEYKLDIFSTLSALDRRDKDYYTNLNEEEQKAYPPVVIMRWMSHTPDKNGLHSYHLQAINEFVNVDFWELSKHKELQHKLLSIVGLGSKQNHQWLSGPKKPAKDKVRLLFEQIYKGVNDQELKLIYKNYTDKDFKQLCKDYGLQNDEIKEYVDNFKKRKKEI